MAHATRPAYTCFHTPPLQVLGALVLVPTHHASAKRLWEAIRCVVPLHVVRLVPQLRRGALLIERANVAHILANSLDALTLQVLGALVLVYAHHASAKRFSEAIRCVVPLLVVRLVPQLRRGALLTTMVR